MDQTNKVAVVTGGAAGIGEAIARRLAASGHTMVIGDLSIVEPSETAHPLDVTDPDSCRTFVAAVLDRYGRLDVLVNNAGINHRRTAAETTREDWDRIIGTNLGGTFTMSVAAYAALRASNGCVVNLGSTSGHVAIAGAAAYGVSKAAIMHLTRVLALEWAGDRIRVNAVAPTIVETAMTADVLNDPEYMTAKLASIPLGRMVTREDVAGAVAYLTSADAVSVTGQVLFVDGGVSIV